MVMAGSNETQSRVLFVMDSKSKSGRKAVAGRCPSWGGLGWKLMVTFSQRKYSQSPGVSMFKVPARIKFLTLIQIQARADADAGVKVF